MGKNSRLGAYSRNQENKIRYGSSTGTNERQSLAQRIKAPTGFEPVHKGFADLSLTTWVRRRISLSIKWISTIANGKKIVHTRENYFKAATLFGWERNLMPIPDSMIMD
jgi:hypothetical protein